MLGPALSKVLKVGLAYTWPTYMTFKAVTLSDHDATRQWCIYWIILGLFLSLEWITDILLWWLPLYHEGKLLCLVLMWHPRVNGAQYVFGHVIQPFLVKHEGMIDSTLSEAHARLTGTLFGHIQSLMSQIRANAGYLLDSMHAFSQEGPQATTTRSRGHRE